MQPSDTFEIGKLVMWLVALSDGCIEATENFRSLNLYASAELAHWMTRPVNLVHRLSNLLTMWWLH